MASFPVPETDWNVVTTMRLILTASWIGLSTMTMPMVEQFGFAMMPAVPAIAWAFTSGTTSGTFGSMRKALELSITTAPDVTADGANSRLRSAPAEKSAISTPLNGVLGQFPDNTASCR